ncbi:Clavaminate synthase-like protein [Polychaeton citri CBS 116435]|uniref:Clavaminate synthase-like protein n=1 Tax=Polychaeton citri CBS 116435 TaxID=1314669 RepID=A0A9P4QH60_9PEZI|nr:Clavaminate synthase-like protein [Polychaeton citri CBS 116435]
MTTTFSSLPVVELGSLGSPSTTQEDLGRLGHQLYDAFATTGFAYLTNAPLSFTHEDVFQLAKEFFQMSQEEKMRLAKNTFVRANSNTYRGYFPPQPGQKDNLKEGFEVGSGRAPASKAGRRGVKFDLSEGNVWPAESAFQDGRARLEKLYSELQDLSSILLSLLAVELSKPADFFASYLEGSISTLRLLHYPPQPDDQDDKVKLCCTPHTDSGILTLLHQDQTGGLEVQNAAGDWVPAPYIPGSIIVNIGDLLSQVSGGRLVATMHRVRTSSGYGANGDGMGRFSVPFFFEPGEACLVRSVDGREAAVYGEHVRRKMGTWVEFQDVVAVSSDTATQPGIAVEAY